MAVRWRGFAAGGATLRHDDPRLVLARHDDARLVAAGRHDARIVLTAGSWACAGFFVGGDVAHAQLVEHLVQELLLFGIEIALGLLLEHGQEVNHLPRGRQVAVRGAGGRVIDIPEMHRRRRRQRHDEREKRGLTLVRVLRVHTQE